MAEQLDILLANGDRHMTFLTDREGSTVIEAEGGPPEAWLEEVGLTGNDIAAVARDHINIFDSATSFLIHCTDTRLHPTAKTDPMAFYLEFEISHELLPGRRVQGPGDTEGIAAWESALTLFAPMLTDVGTAAARLLGDRSGKATCLFDLAGLHGGTIALIVPLELAGSMYALEQILFRSEYDTQPSGHRRVGALGRIGWRAIDDEAALLPPRAAARNTA